MVDVLLDTHVLIWWWTEDDRLSDEAAEVIANAENRIVVSAASAWEIATKDRIGKLGELSGLGDRFAELVGSHGFSHLSIDHRHATWAGGHRSSHRDPFDRMLAAQAHLEGLALVSRDRAFDDLGVDTIW